MTDLLKELKAVRNATLGLVFASNAPENDPDRTEKFNDAVQRLFNQVGKASRRMDMRHDLYHAAVTRFKEERETFKQLESELIELEKLVEHVEVKRAYVVH